MWNGGAPGWTYVTGLAARASSGASATGAPISCASRKSGAWESAIAVGSAWAVSVVRSAAPYRSTTPATASKLVSPEQRGEVSPGGLTPRDDPACVHAELVRPPAAVHEEDHRRRCPVGRVEVQLQGSERGRGGAPDRAPEVPEAAVQRDGVG